MGGVVPRLQGVRGMSRFLVVLCLAVLPALEAAEEAWTVVEPVPRRFPVVRDRLGYSWELTAAGSFFSSGGNVFDSANQLAISGEPFVAERVETRQGRHAFTGRCGRNWAVRREVWVDTGRAAAIHIEEVRNDSGERRRVEMTVVTHVRTPWRGWSSREGRAWVESGLHSSTGAFLTFAPREGDSDLFFLLGDSRGVVPFRIEAAEQIFKAGYECELEPGATLRILHALGQRRSAPGEGPVVDPFQPFFDQGRIALPGVAGALANFAEPAAGVIEGIVWTARDGTEWRLAEPCPEEIELAGALGRVRLRCDEIARFDGWVWTTRDGFRFRAVACPGQVVRVATSAGPVDVELEDLRGIRVPGEVPASPDGSGLRLRNGDVWPGRPVEPPPSHADR
jgi:hypothetical protein